MVGQRLVQGLQGHPWFELVAVAASERSADRPYAEASRWRLGGDPPESSESLRVLRCDPGQMPKGVHLVLSALDNEVAGEVETGFAEAGFAVVSNAGAHRMDPRVPLVIPEVNPEHLSLVSEQPTEGFVVTNPNCSAMPVAMVLAPLHAAFGVRSVVAATWQAMCTPIPVPRKRRWPGSPRRSWGAQVPRPNFLSLPAVCACRSPMVTWSACR
jgi:aspartate-semialdehyde dehydrogenase